MPGPEVNKAPESTENTLFTRQRKRADLWQRRLPVAQRLSRLWLVVAPEEQRLELFLLGPNLVQRVALEQLSILHYPVDAVRVVNIFERVFVEYQKVREFSGLDRADVVRASDNVRTVHCRASQNFHGRHPAAAQHPHFPVVTEPLQLAVAAHTNQPSGAFQFRHLRRQLWKGKLVLPEPSATAFRFMVDNAMRSEMIELYVVMHVRRFIKIVLSEWAAII